MNPADQVDQEYPEHAKMRAVKPQSQAIGAFLTWLFEEKKLEIAEWHEHTERCRVERCDLEQGQLVSAPINVEKILAEYFEIDLNKIGEEKDHMVEVQRRLTEGA